MASPWVENMLKLQELDMRIKDLNARLSLLPVEMKKLIEKRDLANASTNEMVEKVKKINRIIKAGEMEIKNREEKLQKLRQQSSMVKKNSEYTAMLAEIDKTGLEIGKLESKILETMDILQVAKAKGRKLKAQNDAIISSAKTEYDECVSFTEDVKNEIAKLQKERPQLEARVNTEALSKYNQLLKGKNANKPLAEVVDGICGNCHMRVTMQSMNAIKKGEFTSCDNCQHLIYSEDSLY